MILSGTFSSGTVLKAGKIGSILWIHWSGQERLSSTLLLKVRMHLSCLIIQGFVSTFKYPPSVYCFQNIPSRLELMLNVLTYFSSEEWDWIAIAWITLTSLKSSCRNWILSGSELSAHHDDSGDSSFILRLPCHDCKTDPSYVNTLGYSKFLVVFEASIDRVQTANKKPFDYCITESINSALKVKCREQIKVTKVLSSSCDKKLKKKRSSELTARPVKPPVGPDLKNAILQNNAGKCK